MVQIKIYKNFKMKEHAYDIRTENINKYLHRSNLSMEYEHNTLIDNKRIIQRQRQKMSF